MFGLFKKKKPLTPYEQERRKYKIRPLTTPLGDRKGFVVQGLCEVGWGDTDWMLLNEEGSGTPFLKDAARFDTEEMAEQFIQENIADTEILA